MPELRQRTHALLASAATGTLGGVAMLARKIVSTVVIAGGLLLAPALPTQAAPSGGCPSPPNRPVLTMTASPGTVTGAQAATLAGSFKQNSCGIVNAKVHVQSRPLVNGQPAGTWKTFVVVTTNKSGGWKTTYAPMQDVRVRVFFSKAGRYPTTFSPVRSLLDAIRITKHVTTPAGCKIRLTGSTTPVKANRKVFIQQRGPKGQFQGWTTIGSTLTHNDGAYATTAAATCGKTYNLRAFMKGDAHNEAGHSGTTFGIQPQK
jgi:hypothetical protein